MSTLWNKKRALLLISSALMVVPSFGIHAQSAAGSSTGNGANASASAATGHQAATNVTISDVVVTSAPKTTAKAVSARQIKKFQKKPVSVTVVTQQQIEDRQIVDLNTAARQVAGVGYKYGNLMNEAINIRGLGNANNTYVFGEPMGVPVNIDGVYYQWPGTWSLDIPDLVGVDVLKGPQGTAGGFESLSGVFNVHTAEPSFTTQEKVEVSTGSYGLIQGKASATGAIAGTDWAAFRLSLLSTDQQGYVHSTTNPAANYNDQHAKAGRLQFLLAPTQDLTARIIADYSAISTHVGRPADGEVWDYANGAPYTNATIRGEKIGYTPFLNGLNSYSTDVFSPEPEEAVESFGASADVSYKFNGYTLSSLSAFRQYDFHYHGWDNAILDVDTARQSAWHPNARSVQEDINITTPANPLVDSKTGIDYYWTQWRSYNMSYYGAQTAEWYNNTATPTIAEIDGENFSQRNSYDVITSNTLSPYSQAVWHVAPKVDVTTGLRYDYTDKAGFSTGTLSATTVNSYTTGLYGDPAYWNYFVHTHEGDVTGKVSIAYYVTPDITPYVTWARGVRPGGPNITADALPAGASYTIKPEINDNYEIGIKNLFLGGRIATAFDAFWENDRNYITTLSQLSSGNAISYMANAPRVISRGFEGEIRAQVTDDVSLRASGTYDDAFYASFPSAPCPIELTNVDKTCNFDGKSLQIVPRWAFVLGADYSHSLGVTVPYLKREAIGFIGGDYEWQSATYSDPTDSIYTIIPAYGILNFHGGVKTDDDKFKFTAWLHNALDKHYYLSLSATNVGSGVIAGEVGAPLEAGVTLDATW